MSLAQLRREANALRLRFVHELRVVRARRVVEDYCDIWAGLISKKKLPPGPFRLLRNLQRHTGNPNNFRRAHNYLDQCRERRELPHPNGILINLLPTEADRGLISYRLPAPVKY